MSTVHEARAFAAWRAAASEPCLLRVRSVWISDVHLGTASCQAGALLDFLRAVETVKSYSCCEFVSGMRS